MNRPLTSTLSRRQVLKTFLVTVASASLGETHWHGLLVTEVGAAAPAGNSWLRLDLNDFPSLQNDFGSVRLGTSPLAGTFPRGLFWPVIINRAPGGRFHALDSECTHASCVVRPYSPSAQAMICPCHSSRFAIDGRRISGPADFALTAYEVRFDGSSRLDVLLPPWVFTSSGRIVQSGAAVPERFRIEFLSFADMTYEVRYRATAQAAWELVPFALTPDGPADQLALAGRDDSVAIYLERKSATGFYSVNLRIMAV